MAERPSKFPFLGFGPIPAKVTAWSGCVLQPADTIEHSWLKPVPGDPGHWVVTTTKGGRRAHHDRTSGQASLEATVTALELPADIDAGKQASSPPASPPLPSNETNRRDTTPTASPPSSTAGPSPATVTAISTPGASSVDAAGVVAAAIDSGYRMSPNRERSAPVTPPPAEEEHTGNGPTPRAAAVNQRSFSRPSRRQATPTPQRSSASPRRYDSKARFGRLAKALEASRDPALKPPPQPGSRAGSVRSPPRGEDAGRPRRVTSWETRLLTDDQKRAQRAARTKSVQSRKERFEREHVLSIALDQASASPMPGQVPRAGVVGSLLSRAALGHF